MTNEHIIQGSLQHTSSTDLTKDNLCDKYLVQIKGAMTHQYTGLDPT